MCWGCELSGSFLYVYVFSMSFCACLAMHFYNDKRFCSVNRKFRKQSNNIKSVDDVLISEAAHDGSTLSSPTDIAVSWQWGRITISLVTGQAWTTELQATSLTWSIYINTVSSPVASLIFLTKWFVPSTVCWIKAHHLTDASITDFRALTLTSWPTASVATFADR